MEKKKKKMKVEFMKKILGVIMGIIFLTASYPCIASSQDITEKTPSLNNAFQANKKFYFCYIELEGVWTNNSKIMYWGFPYLTKILFGGFDDLDSIFHFVFLWNITFGYKDASIFIYRKQGGDLLYEQHDLENVKIFFFTGFYNSSYYYATLKGNVFFVEPL